MMLGLTDWIGIAGLVLTFGGLVAAVIQLTKRAALRDRLVHRDENRRQVEALLERYARDDCPSVNLVNAARYERDFDGGNDFTLKGYQQLYAELLGTTDEGIECIVRHVDTWYDTSDQLTTNETDRRGPGATLIGVIPYENLQSIQEKNDYYLHRPFLIVDFAGRGRSPYVTYRYREVRGMTVNPAERLYYPPIDELGSGPISRTAGLQRIVTGLRMQRANRRGERRREREGLSAGKRKLQSPGR